MPYITTERVKEIRNELKREFPSKDGWKFSIRRRHHSTVCVDILSAPIRMTEEASGHECVNQFYIRDNYKDKPEVMEVLTKITDIMRRGNKIVSVDGDYGAIPNFYTNLSIGRWDKPFVMKTNR